VKNERGSSVIEKLIVIAVFVLPVAWGVARLASHTNETLECQGQKVLGADGSVTCVAGTGGVSSPNGSTSANPVQDPAGNASLRPDRTVEPTVQGELQFQGFNASGRTEPSGSHSAANNDWDAFSGAAPTDGQRILSGADWAQRLEDPTLPFDYDGSHAPTIEEMLWDPEVQRALEAAWNRPSPIPGRPAEQGGWIYLNTTTGQLETIDQAPGAQAAIDLWNHPVFDNLRLVGVFHTHPNHGDGWRSEPSPQDHDVDVRRGVPDIVRTHNGIYLSGPHTHERWSYSDAPRTYDQAGQLATAEFDAMLQGLPQSSVATSFPELAVLPPPGGNGNESLVAGPSTLPVQPAPMSHGPWLDFAGIPYLDPMGLDLLAPWQWPTPPAPPPPRHSVSNRPPRFHPYQNPNSGPSFGHAGPAPATHGVPGPSNSRPSHTSRPPAPLPNPPAPAGVPGPSIQFEPVVLNHLPAPPPRDERIRPYRVRFDPPLVDQPSRRRPARRNGGGNNANHRGPREPQPPPGPSSGGSAGPSHLQGQTRGQRFTSPARNATRRFEVLKVESRPKRIKILTGAPGTTPQ
jgi:hypothetical protein